MVGMRNPGAIASGQTGPSTLYPDPLDPLDNFLPTVISRLFYGMNRPNPRRSARVFGSSPNPPQMTGAIQKKFPLFLPKHSLSNAAKLSGEAIFSRKYFSRRIEAGCPNLKVAHSVLGDRHCD